MNIGLAYLELHKYDKSLDNLKNGLKLFTEIDDKNYISYSYSCLSQLYEAIGNYKESLKYNKKYSKLRDSLYSEESSQKIAEAEILYETEKKENSIKLLTKEKELQSLQIEKQEYFRNFFIALSVLILALAIIIFSRFIIKRKANKLLEEKNKDLAEKNFQIERQKTKIENQSEKLKELDEAKSRFFANISHEFRTPLMLIRGPLDDYIKNNKSRLSPEEFNNLKLSLRNVNNLQKLIEQLLDLSKLEAGKLSLRAAKTNLIPFVKRIIDSFASAGKLIDIEFITDVDELFLYFDEEKLEKVMNNLLSNAYKFVHKEGKVTIMLNDERTEDDENVSGSFVSIEVKDTGTGIIKEDIPYIFDRFYQADDSSVRKYEGTGIGLALTKELIELHGGTISVESEVGIGTTFTIQLPKGTDHLSPDEIVDISETDISSKPKEVSELDISRTPEIIDESERIKGSNILVVEDNFDMRNYIVGHISKDYNIIEASNGKEGLTKVLENIPDLIISDLMMPEMDGVQFLKEIRNNIKTSDIPFILLTARAGEQDRIAGLKAKADDYLTKPFSPEEIKTRIRNILETRQNLQEKFSKKILSIEFDNPDLVSADKEFLQRMRDTVIENISDSSFSINNLIDKAFLSERQLRRRIKELTGLSPLEFIRQIRLLQAKELLSKQVFNSVAEISVAVGFNNPHYFSRLFKNMFGKSPAEFVHELH
jgi:signal transduction histidine kinase/DNA-binding response OmpR family regulator